MLRCLVATLGKDAPGVNAVIRAVTRLALRRNIEVYGARQGFQGILHRRFVKLREGDVGHILGRGGSILGATDYRLPPDDGESLRQMAESLKVFDLVVAAGGLGSFVLLDKVYSSSDLGLTTTMFVPASIEAEFLDPTRHRPSGLYPEATERAAEPSPGVHAESVGADTAGNTAIEAIDRLRDQAYHTRTVFLVQTVGAKSNYLPIQIGVACGAHRIYLPRFPVLSAAARSEIQSLFGAGFDPNQVDVRELVGWIGHMFETSEKKYLVVLIPNGLPLVHRVPTPSQKFREDHAYEDIVTSMAPLELTALRVVDDLMLYFSGAEAVQIRHVLLDDLQRGGAPSARDRVLGSLYGEAAVEEFLALLNEQGSERRGDLNLLAIDDISRVGWQSFRRPEVRPLYRGDPPRAGGLDPLPFLRQSRGIVSGYRPLAAI